MPPGVRFRLLHVLLSLAWAVVLVILGAQLAESFHWPLLHGWALAHGAIFIVFPVYFLVAYLLLWPTLRRTLSRESHTDAPRQMSALAVISLVLALAGAVVPLVFSLGAVVIGSLAIRNLAANSALYGRGVALTGVTVGTLGAMYHAYIIWAVNQAASHATGG